VHPAAQVRLGLAARYDARDAECRHQAQLSNTSKAAQAFFRSIIEPSAVSTSALVQVSDFRSILMSLFRGSRAYRSRVVGVSMRIAPLWLVVRERNRGAESPWPDRQRNGYSSASTKSALWTLRIQDIPSSENSVFSVTGRSPDLRVAPPVTPISLLELGPHWRCGSFP
jgi:hypothetical protein